MQKKHNLIIGALSGLAYFLAFLLVGYITGFANNLGALFLLPLNSFSMLTNGWLHNHIPNANGLISAGIPYHFARPILAFVRTAISAFPNIMIGACIGWLLPTHPTKRLFTYSMCIQLLLSLIVGIPLMFHAFSQF